MKVELHRVLVQPLLTEKITALREKANTVGFVLKPLVVLICCQSHSEVSQDGLF